MLNCFAGCSFYEIISALGLTSQSLPKNPYSSLPVGPTSDQIAAQKKATRLWQNSKPANPLHTYLLKKRIQPFFAREIGSSLIIPLQNSSGVIWNIQFIRQDGSKCYLKGGMTPGLFTVLGELSENRRVYIAEGFATAATIHSLTKNLCFISFTDSNLPAIAQKVRRCFPQSDIIIAADADDGGEKYSEKSAREVGGMVAYAKMGSSYGH